MSITRDDSPVKGLTRDDLRHNRHATYAGDVRFVNIALPDSVLRARNFPELQKAIYDTFRDVQTQVNNELNDLISRLTDQGSLVAKPGER